MNPHKCITYEFFTIMVSEIIELPLFFSSPKIRKQYLYANKLHIKLVLNHPY